MLFYKLKSRSSHPEQLQICEFSDRVTVQLPVYNEMYVVERLIDAVCKLDYDRTLLEIQVLDDSTDETTEIIKKKVAEKSAAGIDIKHIHRTNRNGFKSGALREGLTTATGKYIAIFDADFIPRPDFLYKVLPYFANEKIGMVQTRWEHLNENSSLLTRVQSLALNGHFLIEQSVRNKAGFFINFNGTGGIWRNECIVDSGNWQDDTLTEDLDLSYRAQLNGWKFIFLKDITTPSELPDEINALKSQQFRWTKGAIETARKILPLVWQAQIPVRIKLQSTFHLTGNFVFPAILLTGILNVPLILVKQNGQYETLFNIMSVFLLAFLSSFLFYVFAQKELYVHWIKKIFLFPLFLAGSMGLAVNNSLAVLQGLMHVKSEFVRTPKYGGNISDNSFMKSIYFRNTRPAIFTFIELALALYCLAGVFLSIYYFEFAVLPFHLLFFAGFAFIAAMSFRHSYLIKRG